MEDEDAELMLQFKEGDDSVFKKIFEKYKRPLLNVIYRFIGTRSEAEDIAQEVFLKVYNARHSYEATAKFSTYIYKIARNLCFNWNRHKQIIQIFPLDSSFSPASSDYADTSLEKDETVEQVLSALKSLPEKQRLAIILREYEKRSYEEIAGVIDCSVSAVKSIIFRARENLRHLLSKYLSGINE